MKNLKRLAASALIIGIIAIPGTASAIGTFVGLGTAGSYAVLADETITSTGPTIVNGDLGLHPGTSVTGFVPDGPGVVNGVAHVADTEAGQAQSDLDIAYGIAAGQAPDFASTEPTDIGGLVLPPGVYHYESSLDITGTVTLDAAGDPDAVWIFQVGSTLITAPDSTVALINEAQACNVFWQVGSSATLDTDTTFVGTIMALTSITLNTRAQITGRALAREGSVTLDSNVITVPACAEPEPTPTPTPTPTAEPTATPTAEPTATPTPTPTAEPTATPTPTLAPTLAPTDAPTDAPTIAPIATDAPTSPPDAGTAPAATAAAASPIPAAITTPAPTNAPAAAPSDEAETAPTVNGPRIVVDAPTVDLTLPPTDTEALVGGDPNAQNFGGVLVLLGGLLVLAAAFIARRQPARR